MNNKHRKEIYLLFFLIPFDVLATAPTFCTSNEVTKCFGITKTQCTQAYEKAFELCSNYYGIDEKPIEEARSIMSEVITCTTKQFYLLSSINEDNISVCKSHFNKNLN